MDEASLPSGKTDLRDWLNLAAEWAELVYQVNSLPGESYLQVQPNLAAARDALDHHFWTFLQSRYSAVHHYQDGKGPICLTAVNAWLHQHVILDQRLALLCFDGLALDQWLLLRDCLNSRLPGLSFHEGRTYAVAPTLTPISRQALFAARPPTAFAETLSRTDKDPDRWQAYWINHNVPPRRVAYISVQVSGAGLDQVSAITESKNRRLAVLINLFDDVMHAVEGVPPEADKRVFYDVLRSHLENGHLHQLLDQLLAHDYRVFLTADHGNIAGAGTGLKPPKALIETFARRVILFDRAELAAECANTHGLRTLPSKALPPDVHPVYMPGTCLLAAQGTTHISHGGLSLEELVVLFVEVTRQ
jgi:hypothetical protein